MIEAPRSPALAGRGIFDRKEVCYFQIRSLTPQSLSCSGTGNALAFAVQSKAERGQVASTNLEKNLYEKETKA